MNLVTIRPGVIFEADAAASFRRLEAEVGTIPCNSTYRDPVKQLAMHKASVAYENGTGPYPGHSYAVHPDASHHCNGEAFDSPRSLSIRTAARRHGWVHVTRAGEEHHLERRADLDQHRNQPTPAGEQEDNDMTPAQAAQLANVEALLASINNAIGDPKIGILRNASLAAGKSGDALAAANNVERILTGVANAINDPRIGVLVASNDARTAARAALEAVGKLSTGESDIDVTALATELRKTIGADVAVELAKRLTE